VIAPNFQGLGLPQYLWFQVINLLMNIEGFSSDELSCNPSVGELCTFTQACDAYSILWDYSFKINFSDDKTNYLNVPLGAFAANTGDSGTC